MEGRKPRRKRAATARPVSSTNGRGASSKRAPQRKAAALSEALAPTDVESTSDRRAEILAAAAELIAEHGFEVATLRQIGDAAGILGGSLYHHFADKQQILHELLNPLRGDGLARARAAADVADPEIALRRLLRFTIDQFAEAPHRLAILNNESNYFLRTPEFAYAWDYGQAYAHIFRDIILRGMNSGIFRRDLDIELTKVLIVKVVNTTPLWFKVGERYSIEAAIDAQMDLILHGVSARREAGSIDIAEIRRDLTSVLTSFDEGCVSRQGRKSELLQIAAKVFAQRGFEATSVRHVSDAAGILPASVYHHFKDKNEILHDLVKTFGSELVSAYQAIVMQKGPADLALYRALVFATVALNEHPDLNLILNREDRFFHRTPQFSYAWTYGQDVARIFYGLLQEGQRGGVFRSSLRVEIVTVLVTKLISAIVEWSISSEDADMPALISSQLDFIAYGISTTVLET